MKPVVFCVLYVIGALVGDTGLALWAKGRPWPWLLGAMVVHAGASAFWGLAMRAGYGFGRSAAMLILANLAGTVLIARFGFEEHLLPQHILGLVLSCLAIYLLA